MALFYKKRIGGEQYSVLVYRSRQERTVEEWLNRFNITSTTSSTTSAAQYDYDLQSFLNDELGWDIVHADNMDWGRFAVGCLCEYDDFTEEDEMEVIKICSEYGLEKPTYFGAIKGEFE